MNINQLTESLTKVIKEAYDYYTREKYQQIMVSILRSVKSKNGLHFYRYDNTQYTELVDNQDNNISGIYLGASFEEPVIDFSCNYGKDYFFDRPIENYMDATSFGFTKKDSKTYTLPIDEDNFEQQVKNLIPFVNALMEVVEDRIKEKRDYFLQNLKDISEYQLGYYTLYVNGQEYTTTNYKDWQQAANACIQLGDKVKYGFCPTYQDKITNLYYVDFRGIGACIFKTAQDAEKAIDYYYNARTKRRESVIIPKIETIPMYLDKQTINKLFIEKLQEYLYILFPDKTEDAHFATIYEKLLYKFMNFGTIRNARIMTSKLFKSLN